MRRRPLALLLLLLGSLLVPGTAQAGSSYEQVVDLTFPFERGQQVRFHDDYDDKRTSTRHHQSTDLMVPLHTPVYAATSGTVGYLAGTASGPASWGYAVYVAGSDGRTYAYLHLGTQTGPPGHAYAPGISRGARVERGQLLGWAGCSGSASCGGGEHLHFEIHDPRVTDPYDYHDEERINPYRSLLAAVREGDYPRPAAQAGGGGPYGDIAGNVHRTMVERLDAAGVAFGCDVGRYCPQAALTRAEMAVFLARSLDLPLTDESFTDVDHRDPAAREIGAIARAGITLGCNPPANDRFCPDAPVRRDQMASFFVRSLELSPTAERFADVASDNVHHRDIGALGTTGITRGCNPPTNDRYCPKASVTRAQMASFLVRAFGL